MLSQPIADQLESIIDKSNLGEVIAAIIRIADEKAEHVAANWQDKALEREWRRASDALYTARTKIHV